MASARLLARPTNATFFAAWVERLTAMIHLASFESSMHSTRPSCAAEVFARWRRSLTTSCTSSIFQTARCGGATRGQSTSASHTSCMQIGSSSRRSLDCFATACGSSSPVTREAGFDPFVDNCSKLCAPISFVAPGNRPHAHKRCWDLNKEDDYQTRKARQRYDKNNSWPQLRGMFWHPRAYAAIPGCVRNLTRQEHAASVYERLVATVWSHDAVLPVMRSAKHGGGNNYVFVMPPWSLLCVCVQSCRCMCVCTGMYALPPTVYLRAPAVPRRHRLLRLMWSSGPRVNV